MNSVDYNKEAVGTEEILNRWDHDSPYWVKSEYRDDNPKEKEIQKFKKKLRKIG